MSIRLTDKPVGAVKTMLESGPIFTVTEPVVLWPPLETRGIVKLASPWLAGVKASTGSTVKEHPERVTAILLASTPVASPQVMV